eukprot:6107132-Amphidinium_carterae.1
MVAKPRLMQAITGASTDQFQSASLLRLFRLLRLARMARVIRLLRAMPELMILCRGILVASRAVFFTLCLLVLLVASSDVLDKSFRVICS